MRHFLQSKASYTEIALVTSKIKRMKTFARFENEIRFIDQPHFGELAEYENGEKLLLVRQDVLDRNVNSKKMNTKTSEKHFVHF